jgi:uncharacterized protein
MEAVQGKRRALTPSTLVGLGLPLVGMPVWYLIGASPFGRAMEPNTRTFIGSMVTFGLALGVVAVVLLWEKQPLSALGIHRQTPRKIIFALSAAIVIAVGGTLISLGLMKLLGMEMTQTMPERILRFPVWLGAWLVISSSIAEELLYRGYVLERLGEVTGSIWWGGLITLVWFTLLHLPLGLSYTLAIVLPGSLWITLLYVWRRDLIATIIVHFVFNAPVLAAVILFGIMRAVK